MSIIMIKKNIELNESIGGDLGETAGDGPLKFGVEDGPCSRPPIFSGSTFYHEKFPLLFLLYDSKPMGGDLGRQRETAPFKFEVGDSPCLRSLNKKGHRDFRMKKLNILV